MLRGVAKMTTKKRLPKAARALFVAWGRIGGSAKTPAKSAAAIARNKTRAARKKAALLAIMLGWLAAPAAAQDPLVLFDKRSVAGFGVETTMPAELDGIPGTIELIQFRVNPDTESLELRGLAFRAAGVCFGTWFDPFVRSRFVWGDVFRLWYVARVGLRDVAYVEGGQTIQPIAIGYGCQQ